MSAEGGPPGEPEDDDSDDPSALKIYGPEFDLEGSGMIDEDFDSEEVRQAMVESHEAMIEWQKRQRSLMILGPPADLAGSTIDESEFETDEERRLAREAHATLVQAGKRKAARDPSKTYH